MPKDIGFFANVLKFKRKIGILKRKLNITIAT